MSMQVMERPTAGPAPHAPCGTSVSHTGSDLLLKLPLEATAPGAGPCVRWEAYCGHDNVGYASLEYDPAEFDPILIPFSTVLRLYIYPKFRRRGLGSKLGRAFITQLRNEGFSRPLLASHMAGDEAAAHILIQCGFLYTGCKTTGPGGQVCRHMLALL
jgi:GNAT superfamily N-acetyltransferase